MVKLLLLCIIFTSQIATAKDFGKVGNTFEIIEEDMLEYIKRKLLSMEKDIEAINKDLQNKTESYVRRPKPVPGITKVTKNSSKLFDPTYVLKEDIINHDGNVMHKAGTKVNPLDYNALPSILYFIDGDDKEQVEWIRKEIKAQTKPIKIILVKGDHINITKDLGVRIYFDQGGIICKKLEITAVPSFVRQKGNKLEIVEEKP